MAVQAWLKVALSGARNLPAPVQMLLRTGIMTFLDEDRLVLGHCFNVDWWKCYSAKGHIQKALFLTEYYS